MKAFIVNLECDSEKRAHIESECRKQEIDFELIKAVDGRLLTDAELAVKVFRHDLNYLTKGEIGCALSHQDIYEKIISQNLDYALILEDDALLSDELKSFMPDFMRKIDKSSNKVYLLQKANTVFLNRELKINAKFSFYEAYNAKCTHGYIITNQAARTLRKINTPLIREADHWLSFYQLSYIKVCALNHDLVISKDVGKVQSSIELERNARTKEQLKNKDSVIRGNYKYRAIKMYHKYIRRAILKKGCIS